MLLIDRDEVMLIADIIAAIKDNWLPAEPASQELILLVQSDLGIIFPSDYQEFIGWSNGGEGNIGSHYFSPWPIQNIRELNVGYQIPQYLPGLTVIGDDLGPFCYAFDYRSDPINPTFVQVPYGDLDLNSIKILGNTFTAALKHFLLE